MPSEPTPIDESSYTPPSAEERPKLMRTLDDVRAELNEDGWTWAVAILDKHQSALDALAVAVKGCGGQTMLAQCGSSEIAPSTRTYHCNSCRDKIAALITTLTGAEHA